MPPEPSCHAAVESELVFPFSPGNGLHHDLGGFVRRPHELGRPLVRPIRVEPPPVVYLCDLALDKTRVKERTTDTCAVKLLGERESNGP